MDEKTKYNRGEFKMKLKTLKDIELHELLDSPEFKIISSVSKAVIIKGEIRNLAINWAKAKQFNQREPLNLGDWKEFFTITEEELKCTDL